MGPPLICPERLGELVGELRPTINVEFGEQNEGTVGALCEGHCIGWRGKVMR